MIPFRPPSWLVSLPALLASCVAYDADDSTAATLAASAQQRPGGSFTWSSAVAAALQRNPELLALAADARAAGAVTQPLDVDLEYRGEAEMAAAIVDPVALTGFGARGAAVDAAAATAAAAAQRLVVARWRTVAAVVEAFAVDATLAAVPLATIDVDAEPFERAGLASPLAAARLRAARARLTAEAAAIAADRAQNRARLRDLLGLPASAPCEVEGGAPPLDQPPPLDTAVLARPDLAFATAEFRIADAEFRRAVAEQYPTLRLGPDVPLRGGAADVLAMLRLPFGMAGLAAAAGARRDAARERLLATWLAATNEAAAADEALAAARTSDDAATSALDASLQALAVGTVAVEVETDAFDDLAEAAAMVARDTMDRRLTAVARVRAEIARAIAFGWPAAASLAPLAATTDRRTP